MYVKKLYKIECQPTKGWSSNPTSIVGWEIDGLTLRITNVRGQNITWEAFWQLVLKNRKQLEQAIKEAGYERKCPYKVESYFTYRQHYDIVYLQRKGNFWAKYQKGILYVSCVWKMPSQEIFIPDLMLLLSIERNFIDKKTKFPITEIKNIITDPEQLGFTYPFTYPDDLPF